jgi:hypothetical protein
MIRLTGVPIAEMDTGLRSLGGVGPQDDDLAEATAVIGRGERKPCGVGALVSGVERPPPLGVAGMDTSSGSDAIALWSNVSIVT